MPGRFWHIEITRKGGRKYISLNHPSKRAALRFAEDEEAVDWNILGSSERRESAQTSRDTRPAR